MSMCYIDYIISYNCLLKLFNETTTNKFLFVTNRLHCYLVKLMREKKYEIVCQLYDFQNHLYMTEFINIILTN